MHSALLGGLRFTQFWTSMCGIPNCSGWSPRPDFDGLDQFHHWTLRKSQGEAGQGGAHLEGPRCLQSPWKKIFTYKIFLVLQLLLAKFFKFYTIKMEKCQICGFDQLIKSQKEVSQEKTLLVKFTQNFTNWEWIFFSEPYGFILIRKSTNQDFRFFRFPAPDQPTRPWKKNSFSISKILSQIY